jgi:hypothetical protein
LLGDLRELRLEDGERGEVHRVAPMSEPARGVADEKLA